MENSTAQTAATALRFLMRNGKFQEMLRMMRSSGRFWCLDYAVTRKSMLTLARINAFNPDGVISNMVKHITGLEAHQVKGWDSVDRQWRLLMEEERSRKLLRELESAGCEMTI